jgi:protein-tyrosine-phosphatase
MKSKPNVLFFSTGNATRSKMAAAFLARITDEQLKTMSTAVRSVEANPLGVDVMKEVGIDISAQPVAPVVESLKQHFACVVTLSDDGKERRPVWPFTKNIVHWSLRDPAEADGSPEKQRELFRVVRDEILQNVSVFAKTVARELEAAAR